MNDLMRPALYDAWHDVLPVCAGTAEAKSYDIVGPVCESGDFLKDLNPDSVKVIRAQLEPALRNAKAEERFQFERHGYFVADLKDSKPGAPVFNRTVTLRDTWAGQR